MKFLASFLFLALSTLALADIPESADIENNAYVKLYREWLEMDFNQVERLEAIAENTKLDLDRGTRLAEKKVISLEELQDLQLKYKLAVLTLERQQMKIREAEARLSIVKSKVASGVGDIPICIRPMDNM
jgi:multidrug resistance efflux pump